MPSRRQRQSRNRKQKRGQRQSKRQMRGGDLNEAQMNELIEMVDSLKARIEQMREPDQEIDVGSDDNQVVENQNMNMDVSDESQNMNMDVSDEEENQNMNMDVGSGKKRKKKGGRKTNKKNNKRKNKNSKKRQQRR